MVFTTLCPIESVCNVIMAIDHTRSLWMPPFKQRVKNFHISRHKSRTTWHWELKCPLVAFLSQKIDALPNLRDKNDWLVHGYRKKKKKNNPMIFDKAWLTKNLKTLRQNYTIISLVWIVIIVGTVKTIPKMLFCVLFYTVHTKRWPEFPECKRGVNWRHCRVARVCSICSRPCQAYTVIKIGKYDQWSAQSDPNRNKLLPSL